MTGDGSDASSIKQSGWRQGSILGEQLTGRLRTQNDLPELGSGFWFVISHDCDVCNESFEKEPLVELLFARKLPPEEVDGNKFWTKNTRVLQFEQEGATYLCDIRWKCLVSRRCFLGETPSAAIAADNSRLTSSWLAKRYLRSGFPDAFNERARRAVGKIREKAKSLGKWISAIYLVVQDDELPEGKSYKVTLIATMKTEHYEDPELRKEAEKLFGVIEASLSSSSGIDIVESELRSEADVSIDDLRFLKRWDYDDLTYRSDGPQTSIVYHELY